MPCASTPRAGQTLVDRIAQVKQTLARLERYLQTGSVRVGIGPNGAIVFQGWKDRDDVSDVCAFRALSAEGSSVLRMAVARAEATFGRKVNVNAVAAGFHSHDGGHSWSKH